MMMEGNEENGVTARIQSSSFSNCTSSNSVINPVQLGINSQMQGLAVFDGDNYNFNNTNYALISSGGGGGSNYVKRPPLGIPPFYPTQFTAVEQRQVGNFSPISRSLSQPLGFSGGGGGNGVLPPLSQSVVREFPVVLTDGVLSEERISGGGGGSGNGVLPARRGHRRCSSDVVSQLGVKPAQLVLKGIEGGGGDVVDDLINTYMNMDGNEVFNSAKFDSRGSVSVTRTNESSENDGGDGSGVSSNSVERRENGSKRRATGGLLDPPGGGTGRHCRSLSMDSFMGNLNFEESLSGGSYSMDGNGKGEFSPDELKKIMTNEKLADIVKTDPKRVKRILANRVSAARSKERKVRYVSDLEHKVQTLQTEATTMSAQLTALQRDAAELTSENKEMRLRLEAMEQQGLLKNALNETLTAEVQRLRLVAQTMGLASPYYLPQQFMVNNPVFQMPPPSQYVHQSQHPQQTQEQQAPSQSQQSQRSKTVQSQR